MGVYRPFHLNLLDLWETDELGIEIFRTTMNLKQFKFILRNIRFDDTTTCKQQKLIDKLAPNEDIFENVKLASQHANNWLLMKCLRHLENVDPLGSYTRNKPAKYGIKVYSFHAPKHFTQLIHIRKRMQESNLKDLSKLIILDLQL